MTGYQAADPQPTSWAPSAELVENCTLTDFRRWLDADLGLSFDSYDHVWQWSVAEPGPFWQAVCRYFDVVLHEPANTTLASTAMPGATWFPGATVNYAEHALRTDVDGPAIIALHEDCEANEISWSELRGQVGAVSTWFVARGVSVGDRVVGYVANTSEAIVAFLACASIGAIWSSCSPDYSAAGAADRFAQLEPVVLVASASYRFRGKIIDCAARTSELAALLSSVGCTLWIDPLGDVELPTGVDRYDDVVAEPVDPVFTPVAFDHPLWVLYSSGTTGRPKGIVHGHGGILLEHFKLLGLHFDVRPGSRYFCFATPSWMVWNTQVSGLLLGATIFTYDGSPNWPDSGGLWATTAQHEINVLYTSAAYLIGCQKGGTDPGGSTTSPRYAPSEVPDPHSRRPHTRGYTSRCPRCGWPRSAAAPTCVLPSPAASPPNPWWPARSRVGCWVCRSTPGTPTECLCATPWVNSS